jgi:hypothetical protein
VHDIARCRIAMIMDQWEETARDLDQQQTTFRGFLREPEQWPDCHILLSARDGGAAAELLRELEREFPGGAHVQILGEMDLSAESERRRLISFLRVQPQLHAIENVSDTLVLELVGGYPRVIDRWVAEDARETAQTFDGLEGLAREANEFRYSDLEKLLLALDDDHRKLAVRIALVPLAEDEDAWPVLRRILLADIDPNVLDNLKLANVFEKDAEPPRFGHPTRRDAARAFLDRRRRETFRSEAKSLIFALARSITAIDVSILPSVAALAGLHDEARRQNLIPLPLALCKAALRLLGGALVSPDQLIEGAREARKLHEPGFGFVLGTALFNAMFDAKADDDLARRDALLDELRALPADFPDDAAVREPLAIGLFNTAEAEHDLTRRDALLDELRALAHAYADNAAVRQWLAMGLCSGQADAKREDDLTRRDALFDELRALARAFPDDAVVGDELAKSLFDTLYDAGAHGDLARRDALLDELRVLARAAAVGKWRTHSEVSITPFLYLKRDDAAVGKWLAIGLFNTLNDAMAKGDLARRDALLDELRALAQAFPGEFMVGEELAKGLFHTLNEAKAEDDLARRDALLEELRALAQAFPENPAIREIAGKL